MAVHDWTLVDPGLFHHFHQEWCVSLCNSLNGGTLPADYFALVEQNVRGPIPDVLTLKLASASGPAQENGGGAIAVELKPPRTRITRRAELDSYVAKANRIAIRHRHGDVVAVIEIISPENKASRSEFRALVEKSAALMRQGIHLLLIDLFPPTARDPQGIHKAIWDEFVEEDLALPPDRPLTLAAYDAGPPRVAYVEFVGVGEPLPPMPLFLQPAFYVPAPLDETYQAAWGVFPSQLKGLLDRANPRP